MSWVCPKCGYVNEDSADDDDDDEDARGIGSYKFPRCKMCGEPRWYSVRRW